VVWSGVQRQGKGAASVTSLSIGAGDGWATPTSGNLLVATANSDATIPTPSGWTAGPSVVDGNAAYIWWKISAGNESTVTIAPSSSANTVMTVCEYSGNAASPFDVSNSSTISGSSGTTTTSVSVTTTQAGDLIVAFAALHSGATNPTGLTWTNSFSTTVSGSTGATTPTVDSFIAELVATYTSGSGGNTGVARTPVRAGDAAATFTAETLNTTRIAVGTGALATCHNSAFNLRSGLLQFWTPETAFTCSPSQALAIGMTGAPADSVTWVGTAYVAELIP
jgi:ribosomal protein L17